MDDGAIVAKGLFKSFNGNVAVDHVDLFIKRGEIFGLLGPNGAGKSTIIKMLTTMLKPTGGEATVWGYDISEERDEVRSSIGVVFQDPSVDDKLTAYENLDFHGRMYGLRSPLRQERIQEVLDLVDLSEKADVLLEKFSGGMRRRLEIARGLMHHPKVLFLDEPTLGLDAQTRRYIWDYVGEMNRQEKVTVVITTHYMDEADYLCQRVAIIDHGRIAALDTPRALKDSMGGDVITLEVAEGSETLQKALATLEGVTNVDFANGVINLSVDHGQARIPEIVLSARRCGATLKSVGLHEPTLEDVFLRFTGKKMRDAEGKGGVHPMIRR